MYSDLFCKVYNEFGWNYFPEEFGEHLLKWLKINNFYPKTSMDLACGTGILCEILYKQGINASGMDFSKGMIDIARNNNPAINYEVADMIKFCPDKTYDLVTCTGDALNHILNISDVEEIFKNVYNYTSDGGYFIFDILNEKEVSPGEPIDFEYSETIKGQFTISQNDAGIINLNITVFENGKYKFEENITEIVHDIDVICDLLKRTGFKVIRCADQLIDDAPAHATTWFVVAQK